MESFDRDDAPPMFSLRRRRVVASGFAAAGALAVAPLALSQSGGVDANAFMALSRLLIQHRLNGAVGRRIAVAMAAATPGLQGQVDALLAIAKTKNATIVEDFFPDVPEGPLKTTALAIIYAWYAGVLFNGRGSPVFAYELALVFQPTNDVMTIPTYAISAPNAWSWVSPPLGQVPTFRGDIA